MTLPARPVTHPARIAVGGLKGGLTKSTSAWMLAWALHRRGVGGVLLVDSDPASQTTFDSYCTVIAEGHDVPFAVVSWPTDDGLVSGVRAMMRRIGATHLIIDTGGDTERILAAACELCTDLLMPVPPYKPDLRRIPATLTVAARIAARNDVIVHILLTKCDSAANDAAAAREWMTHPDRQLPVMRAQVPDTALYKRALYSVPPKLGVYDDVLDELDAAHGDAEEVTIEPETGVI